MRKQNDYTDIQLSNGHHLPVSRTPFFRVHHSYLVNIQFAIRYIKGEGDTPASKDGTNDPVSPGKRKTWPG
ncbi:MAG TPA: hypothetical protein VKR32_18230 [Puia sp.]|nr:hypothetical protein [Puia sp.]